MESPESILEQASVYLEAEAYEEAFSILDNAGDAIDSTLDTGTVKGVEESVQATTSTEIIEDDVDETSTSTGEDVNNNL